MNLDRFHKSTGKELISLKDRIRDLVQHWGEDGRYKEVILKSTLERMLPNRYQAITGFVVKEDPANRGGHLSSNQIDIIIVDNTIPFVFKADDFGIVTPDAVAAIIEVKTNLENAMAKRTIEVANENGKFIYSGREANGKALFNGIFSYEGYTNFDIDKFQRQYEDQSANVVTDGNFASYLVNHISFNDSWFFKYWAEEYPPLPKRETCYYYDIPELSFSYFISALMEHLANRSIQQNAIIWFAQLKNLKPAKKFRFPV